MTDRCNRDAAFFLVERYAPHREMDSETARLVRTLASEDGGRIRHVRTISIAEDETCLHVFEARSRESLVEAVHRAGFDDARITEVVEHESDAA